MQNPHAQWRIRYARRLTENLAAFKGVRAVIVAGSVARNYADAYSDLEIPIFWDILPDDERRLEIADVLAGRFLFAYDGPSREDQLLIDGVQVDLWHIAVKHEEEIIRAVLHDHRTDLDFLNAMDTIRCCIPMYGEEMIRAWKSQAEEYPIGLAHRIITEHIASFRVDQLEICDRRGDPKGFCDQLRFLQQKVFLVLLALNRCYFPSFKWMYPALKNMSIKPQSIGERFRRGYAATHEQAVAEMVQILNETIRLVEEQFQQVDTDTAHRRMAHRRRATNGPNKG
jgi:hypothetical protein